MNKFEHAMLLNESRVIFNFLQVHENLPGSNIELSSRIHDYLTDSSHEVFMQADIKHEYFSVEIHSENHHYFAFTVPDIGQLQHTRMPQGSRSTAFTFMKLMNLV